MQNLETVIIIPARYQSSRFPGKPLALILGKSLLQRTWEQCCQALPSKQVFVATDSPEIEAHCIEKAMNVIMTPDTCLTGTDRLYFVTQQIPAQIYINVQGDEPLVDPSDILKVIDASKNDPHFVYNAYCSIELEDDFHNPNVPKMVFAPNANLLYASRAPIPTNKKHQFRKGYKQVCIYAFRSNHLKAFFENERKTPLEELEDIEILRFLELGIPVKMIEVSQSSLAVDTPEDIARVEKVLS